MTIVIAVPVTVVTLVMTLSSGCSATSRASHHYAPPSVSLIASRFIHALNRRAVDEQDLWDKLADKFEHRVSQASLRTREDLQAFFRRWDALFVGWKYIETRRVVEGRRVAWEGRAEAIHSKTGKQLVLPLVMFIDIDQRGKVESVHVYFDTGLIQRQLLGEAPPEFDGRRDRFPLPD